MRFTLSSTALNSRLQTLAKVINSKNSLAILESFLFQVHDGKIKITASDSENRMTTELPLDESDTDGEFAIPNRTILDAVKELPEQPLTFEVNPETYEVAIEYQNGRYNFTAQNAEEYPQKAPIADDAKTITISAKVLCDNIARTIFATDNNEIRPVMNGIYFDLLPDCLAFVASDGHKLVRCRYTAIKSEEHASFILPKKPAMLLRTVLDKSEDDVTIKFSSNSAEFYFPNGTLSSTLIEGVFPNYNAAIPTDNTNELVIDRKALLGAIKRVLPFASMSSQLIRFRLENGSLELTSEDLDFATSAKEDIVCSYSGTPLQIGFRGDFFSEILNSITTDDIKMLLGDPSRAGIILPTEQPENEDILMLIMPLLLGE
jgi:DNA polymerase-3 subunit beta